MGNQKKGKKMSKKSLEDLPIRALRKKLRLNQTAFWAHVGVTQSGGSRYETGRNIGKPIRLLIKLVYSKDGELLLRKMRRKAFI